MGVNFRIGVMPSPTLRSDFQKKYTTTMLTQGGAHKTLQILKRNTHLRTEDLMGMLG